MDGAAGTWYCVGTDATEPCGSYSYAWRSETTLYNLCDGAAVNGELACGCATYDSGSGWGVYECYSGLASLLGGNGWVDTDDEMCRDGIVRADCSSDYSQSNGNSMDPVLACDATAFCRGTHLGDQCKDNDEQCLTAPNPDQLQTCDLNATYCYNWRTNETCDANAPCSILGGTAAAKNRDASCVCGGTTSSCSSSIPCGTNCTGTDDITKWCRRVDTDSTPDGLSDDTFKWYTGTSINTYCFDTDDYCRNADCGSGAAHTISTCRWNASGTSPRWQVECDKSQTGTICNDANGHCENDCKDEGETCSDNSQCCAAAPNCGNSHCCPDNTYWDGSACKACGGWQEDCCPGFSCGGGLWCDNASQVALPPGYFTSTAHGNQNPGLCCLENLQYASDEFGPWECQDWAECSPDQDDASPPANIGVPALCSNDRYACCNNLFQTIGSGTFEAMCVEINDSTWPYFDTY